VTLEWQQHIAAVLGETEARLRNQHLISQNIANLKAKVERPDPAVSIFNFHYASPPDAVAMNYQLNKVIGDNETGFRGTNDAPYRMEAWDFMIAGGGLFNHLDYSFTVGHEDGSFVFPASQPGGGTPTLRRQLRFLGDVLRRFDFVRMKPATDVITEGVPPGMTARALARLGSDYLIYLRPAPQSHGEPAPLVFAKGQVALGVALPAGQFIEEWYDPRQCVSIGSESVARTNGVCTLAAPAFQDDLLLVLRRTDGSSPRGSSRPGRFTAIPRPGEAPQEEPVSSLPDLPTVLVVTNVLRHAPDSKPISPQPEQPRSSRMPTEPLASGRDKAPAAEAPQAAVFPPNIVVVTNTLRWTSEPRSGPQTNFEPTRHAMPADKPTPTRATLDFPPSIPDVIVETNLLWRSPSPVASSR